MNLYDRLAHIDTETIRTLLWRNDPNGTYDVNEQTEEPLTREDLLHIASDQGTGERAELLEWMTCQPEWTNAALTDTYFEELTKRCAKIAPGADIDCTVGTVYLLCTDEDGDGEACFYCTPQWEVLPEDRHIIAISINC